MFEKTLFDKIIKSWNGLGENKKAPKLENISSIFETVFLTSIKHEEGISINTRVGLVEYKKIPQRQLREGNFVSIFENSLIFNVQNLCKITTAFNHKTTIIAVSPSDNETNELVIWGVIFVRKTTRKTLDYISGYSPIHVDFIVSTQSPGSLVISTSNDIVGRFSNGEFITPTPSPFIEKALGGYLYRTIEHHPEYREFQNGYWIYYRDFLENLLYETLELGKGGTIVWLPNSAISNHDNLINFNYSIKDSPEGSDLIKDICSCNSKNGEMVSKQILCKKKIIDYIEYLSLLTNRDGALIISDRLKPLSFGSTLRADTWGEQVLSGPKKTISRSSIINLSNYGTRHNSAVNFVGQCFGSVAFVISKDGSIVGLTKANDDTVFWWADILSGLFD